MPGKSLIIIPTYNEIDNVREIIPVVLALPADLEVLVVDDNSPDGTGAAVSEMAARDPRVHLLARPGKMGLGSAYIAGFRWALARDYAVIFEMDADFSHDPGAIPVFLESIRHADLVLGSRYLKGVTVINWPLRRLVLSYGANAYSRLLTGVPIQDLTGGFKAFRREALEGLDLDRVRSDGYSFQIELTFHCWRSGFIVKEIPIIFADRRVGISKMSKRIIFEATWMVWRLFLERVFGRRHPRPAAAVAADARFVDPKEWSASAGASPDSAFRRVEGGPARDAMGGETR